MLISVNEALIKLNLDDRFIEIVNKYICDGDNTLLDIDGIPFEFDNGRIYLVITFDDAYIFFLNSDNASYGFIFSDSNCEEDYEMFLSILESEGIRKKILLVGDCND